MTQPGQNPTYQITRRIDESMTDFLTRVANEIQIMNCRIVKVSTDETAMTRVIIEYQNFSSNGFVPRKEA